MANPEILAQFQRQDITPQDQSPIEGKSFENLRQFLAYGAVAPVRIYPADQKPDYSDKSIYYPIPGKLTTLQDSERDLKILYDWAFGEDTLKIIGKRNGNLTIEATRQIIKRTVRGLYNGAEQAARDRFPFESFDFAKPLTLASRQRISEAQGGKSAEIAKRLEQGATLDQLKKNYTADQIGSTRIVLESWGRKLEREKNRILPQFEGLINPDATNEQIQTPS